MPVPARSGAQRAENHGGDVNGENDQKTTKILLETDIDSLRDNSRTDGHSGTDEGFGRGRDSRYAPYGRLVGRWSQHFNSLPVKSSSGFFHE